ncbi:MAG: GNAT family N-acetyltransferase [Deltaproteobacteria bacterium]
MIVALAELDAAALEELAHVTLASAVTHTDVWLTDLVRAREELADALAPAKTALALIDGHAPIAWVAAGPDWGRIWELHPLIVAVDHQRRGHGLRLVRAVEDIARAAGALTMLLGTSDTSNATSLSNVDLYDHTGTRLEAMTENAPHAVGFWRRAGYSIVDVLPDRVVVPAVGVAGVARNDGAICASPHT